MKWGYYSELRPDDLQALRRTTSIAYVPWGSLEWHGPHLPLGVDGIIAQAMAERMAQQTGGVVLPVTWWPVTVLPHLDSLSVHHATVRALWDDIFAGLAHAGWQVIVVVSGQYAQGQELVLMNAADHAMHTFGIPVLVVPPMSIIDETMLDHAALWETSLMLLLRPELVDLDKLGEGPLTPASSGVIGQDPRGTATASMGKQAITMAVELVARSIHRLLEEGNTEAVKALNEERRLRLRSFVERYDEGSLEDANARWWEDICHEVITQQPVIDTEE